MSMNDILENVMIGKMTKNFIKAPHKKNDIHESDAELIDLGEGYHRYLAATTDVLVEEITSGLYEDPYLIGWMLAAVNFSDLAAVGADPLGLLISINYPPGISDAFIEKMTEGISAACSRLNTFVLGGDTNRGNELFLSGCAVGLVPKESVITRVGAKAGDRLYLTAPAGAGSIYAFLRITGHDSQLPGSFYRPTARLTEGKIIREYANCCMDTSDGVIHTLDTLMRLNRCRFVLNGDWQGMLHPVVLDICAAREIPPWLAAAGVHGEFELCFTISPENEQAFLQEAGKTGWHPIRIGEITEGEGISVRTGERFVPIDSASIRNLSGFADRDPKEYVKKLLEIGHRHDI